MEKYIYKKKGQTEIHPSSETPQTGGKRGLGKSDWSTGTSPVNQSGWEIGQYSRTGQARSL